MRAPISLVLIGGGSMLQNCTAVAETTPGVKVSHVFIKKRDPDTSVQLCAFFAKRGIPHVLYKDISSVKEALSRELKTHELLVSVYNEDKLDGDILSHFRNAINFHPSPLPRYAGLAPESWAILAGESTHGGTWHDVSLRFDAGDIWQQEIFEIGSACTAYDVALQVTRVGCRLFKPLLSDLLHSKTIRSKQDLSTRTYFSRKLLPFGGRFPFLAEIDIADRLRRATEYFPMANPFCIPTVTLNGKEIGLVRFSLHQQPLAERPGTLVCVDQTGASFATTGGVMKADLITIPGGKRARPTDPAALDLLRIGSRAEVDRMVYNPMGLADSNNRPAPRTG